MCSSLVPVLKRTRCAIISRASAISATPSRVLSISLTRSCGLPPPPAMWWERLTISFSGRAHCLSTKSSLPHQLRTRAGAGTCWSRPAFTEVDLRVVPDMYNGSYLEQRLHRIHRPVSQPHSSPLRPCAGAGALVFKRAFDVVFSTLILLLFSPLLLIIAIAVKLDSPGPAFYESERIGKKGRVFHCMKFRTMVRTTPIFARCADVMHIRTSAMECLFKISQRPAHHPPLLASCASIHWTSYRSSSTCSRAK